MQTHIHKLKTNYRIIIILYYNLLLIITNFSVEKSEITYSVGHIQLLYEETD